MPKVSERERIEDRSFEEAVLKAWLQPAIATVEVRALFGLDA